MGILLKGGTVVLEDEIKKVDVLIQSEKIKEIGCELACDSNTDIIDCTNKIIMPGVIDAHTHFYMLCGQDERTVDDFYWGSVAAACGGVTTVIDYVEPLDDESPKKAILNRMEEAENICIDYNLHYVVRQWRDEFLKELAEIPSLGINNLKIFTAYENMMLSYDEIYELLKWSRKNGLLVTVHAEDEELIIMTKEELIKKGKTQPAMHSLSRPVQAEAEAVRKVIDLAAKADAPIYFVHVSSFKAANIIKEAQKRGIKVLAETCPHYLFLNDSLYTTSENPQLYIMCPPLRKESERIGLLNLLEEGVFSVIATDHCSFSASQKLRSSSCFETLAGIPGVETLLPLAYNLVKSGTIDLIQLTKLLSANPAKIFGLYPQKGVIKEGSDADIVIFNPNIEKVLQADMLHYKAGYTPFEGLKVFGYPETTILRGKIIYDNGNFLGKSGYGQFIPGGEFHGL